ncbi:DNA polymerase V [Rouxiella badensis]|uniref:DNA polymerase V n=1 Tax=Rouxiella badensis TaxID=1646377 RepID=UPI001D132FC3|nr:DNA polymerase V [Rouxiella badensis]MCC3703503.1 DNA polymerase V [Rouxiella badensis]
MKIDPKGRRMVTTSDFVAELEKVNWHMSLKEANECIESYTHSFCDISTEEGEARTFQMNNPNGGR